MENIIKRTTLFVRDMEKSLRWYEYVLGMTKWYDNEFIISGEGLAAGKAGDKTHLVILKAEDPTIGMIGLLQWLDPPMEAPAEIPTRVGFGQPVFVVSTDDAQTMYERAKELDTNIYCAPRDWSTKGADGKVKHMIGISMFDPDGYFFECNQHVRTED